MANNIGYRATISSDEKGWIKFKQQNGIIVSEDGQSMSCNFAYPSSLFLSYEKNTNNHKRMAVIKFTQEGGLRETNSITITQEANQKGLYVDGSPFFDKDKSSLKLTSDYDRSYLNQSGGTVTFNAVLDEIISQKMVKKDEDGNIIERSTSVLSEDKIDITNYADWKVNTSSSSDNFSMKNGVLSISANTNDYKVFYQVSASYSGVSATSDIINQKGLQENS